MNKQQQNSVLKTNLLKRFWHRKTLNFSKVQLAFDEELSKEEAKRVRNIWMKHYSLIREDMIASIGKGKTDDNYGDNRTRERDRSMRSMTTIIMAVVVAAIPSFVGGYNLRAMRRPGETTVTRSPEIRRAIPVGTGD